MSILCRRCGLVLSGYLLKNNAANGLYEAIDQIHRGQSYLSPEISRLVTNNYLGYSTFLEKPTSSNDGLSLREIEVLCLIAEGNNSKEAAKLLGISANTVDNHRKAIMSKLNIHNIAGLVNYAFHHGIVILNEQSE